MIYTVHDKIKIISWSIQMEVKEKNDVDGS